MRNLAFVANREAKNSKLLSKVTTSRTSVDIQISKSSRISGTQNLLKLNSLIIKIHDMHNDVTIAVENGVSGKLSSQNGGRKKGAKIEFAF